MSICICIIARPEEEGATVPLLTKILPQITEVDRLVVLANNFQAIPKAWPRAGERFEVIFSSKELGVASARKMLFQSAVAKPAEFVLFLDNDVLVSPSFVRDLKQAALSCEPFAVMGVVALDKRILSLRGIQDNEALLTGLRSQGLAQLARDGCLENLGAAIPWKRAYLVSQALARYVRRKSRSHRVLRPNSEIFTPGHNYWPVSVVPGYSQLWSREALEQVGAPDATFDPYGYEDVDMCIRAQILGWSNYLWTGIVVIHRTNEPSRWREKPGTEAQFERTMERNRILLSLKYERDNPLFWVFLSLGLSLDVLKVLSSGGGGQRIGGKISALAASTWWSTRFAKVT